MTPVHPAPLPLVAAPMAGGPTTPGLAAAVAEAGGLGVLAAGYLTPEALDARVTELRDRTDRPFGVNLFLPSVPTRDLDAVRAYAERLRPEAEARGVELGRVRDDDERPDDDAVDEKIAVLARHRPAVITLTFGLPEPGRLRALHDIGSALVATVTSPEEAADADRLGMDGLCVQGAEAGGHRSMHVDPGGDAAGGAAGLATLLPAVAAVTDLPLVAAGGLSNGADVRRVLDTGAVAAQLGTAFLCCPEAGTSGTHRRALVTRTFPGTLLTRAFTGRPARALANRFALEHGDAAPAAYPEVHHLTRPLRSAAAAADDADTVHLWAGAGWPAVTEEPAGALVGRLAREAGVRAPG